MVYAAPVAGTLSGTQNICVGGTTTFASTSTGGAWTSDNLGVATIDSSTGAISGVTAGTATMTYTVIGTGGCLNATATRLVTVNAIPSAPTVATITHPTCTTSGSVALSGLPLSLIHI